MFHKLEIWHFLIMNIMWNIVWVILVFWLSGKCLCTVCTLCVSKDRELKHITWIGTYTLTQLYFILNYMYVGSSLFAILLPQLANYKGVILNHTSSIQNLDYWSYSIQYYVWIDWSMDVWIFYHEFVTLPCMSGFTGPWRSEYFIRRL